MKRKGICRNEVAEVCNTQPAKDLAMRQRATTLQKTHQPTGLSHLAAS
jgi:hypothetical protein